VRQLPSAAREALAVCDDPRAGVAELARVCEGDLAVAQGLLRYANSALVARPGQAPAASLREAIDRVGAGGVRGVLVDVSVAALLCAPGSRHATYTAQIWTHAQRTAALARAAAPAFGASPDRAYAAGLLHDVGKLVVLDRAAALAAGRAYAAPSWPALRALLAALHEPLGALAVLRWGMGAEAARAVGSHHRAPPPPARDPVGEAVFLAERVDMAVVRGEPLAFHAWWDEGALAGSRARAAELVGAHLGPLAAGAAG
jgi:HD-like signal output (HDOD) protein